MAKVAGAKEDTRPDRHPNGTPKTIHHYDSETGFPVYHHEVVPMDVDELRALGHSQAEAVKMNQEAGGGKKGAKYEEKE